MSSGRRILVVDDDPYTRDLASTALRGKGYEVVGAARFQQGLDAARAQRPHLILSDVVLPDGSGIDLARSLRAELPDREMPIVILMSAFSKGRVADQRQMKEDARAAAFLTKPLSLPAVLDLIQQHLPLAPVPAPVPADPETARLMAPPAGSATAPAGPHATPPRAPATPRPAPADDAALAAVALDPEAVEGRITSARAVATTPSLARTAGAKPSAPAGPQPDGPPGSSLLLGLASAWRKGWTGALTVTREQVEKRIVFERGQVVWCTTTLTEERLGRLLLRLGFLPRDQYEPSLKEAMDTQRRLGEVVVARGYLTQFQLDDALVQQMEGIVLGALAWPEGSYRVVATAGAPPTGDRLPVSPVPRLVVRAFAEVVSGDRLDARLAALGAQPVVRRADVPAAALAQLSPSLEETRFLEALLAPAPVPAQLGRHPHGPDAAAPYLGALLTLGIVDAADAASRAPAPEPAKATARPAEVKAPARPSPAARSAAESAARRLLSAEAAFEAGRSAVERKDLAAAAESISLAMTLCPEEGEYRAWAAWIKALAAREAFDRTLDAVLAEIEQAVALSPSAETIQQLIEGVTRLRGLSRDGEA